MKYIENQRKIKRNKQNRFKKDKVFNTSNKLSKPFLEFLNYLSVTLFLTGVMAYFKPKIIFDMKVVSLSALVVSPIFYFLLEALFSKKARKTSNTLKLQVFLRISFILSFFAVIPLFDFERDMLIISNLFMLITFAFLFLLAGISIWLAIVKLFLLIEELNIHKQAAISMLFLISVPGILVLILQIWLKI